MVTASAISKRLRNGRLDMFERMKEEMRREGIELEIYGPFPMSALRGFIEDEKEEPVRTNPGKVTVHTG